MRICCLMDNRAREGFAAEHGLSLWIEAAGKKLLFDAGESGAFAENAQRLGIELAQADAAVLSHGHYDHAGGMERFLELNAGARLYLRRGAEEPHWSLSTGERRYIGLSEQLLASGRLVWLDGDFELFPGLRLFGTGPGGELVPEANSVLLGPDGLSRDDFRHEQSLMIEEEGRLVLISGCSHCGIVNILRRCEELAGRSPDLVIGGFHLAIPGTDGMDAEYVDAVAARLLARPGMRCCTGHCTGERSLVRLRELMGERVRELNAGDILEF